MVFSPVISKVANCLMQCTGAFLLLSSDNFLGLYIFYCIFGLRVFIDVAGLLSGLIAGHNFNNLADSISGTPRLDYGTEVVYSLVLVACGEFLAGLCWMVVSHLCAKRLQAKVNKGYTTCRLIEV